MPLSPLFLETEVHSGLSKRNRQILDCISKYKVLSENVFITYFLHVTNVDDMSMTVISYSLIMSYPNALFRICMKIYSFFI